MCRIYGGRNGEVSVALIGVFALFSLSDVCSAQLETEIIGLIYMHTCLQPRLAPAFNQPS